MDLELVSFKTCPYVQRSVITLREKGVPFRLTYIDLDDPPPWFQRDSPLGKVPILRIKEGVLFESAVINEYVDEVTPGRLMPDDPWQRAQARAWIEFGSQCLVDSYMASLAPDEATFRAHVDALHAKLVRLDQRIEGPWFLGGAFTLADAALAPLVMRLQELERVAPGFSLDAYSALREWAQRLTERDSVAGSIVPEWRELHAQYVRKRGGYLAHLLAEG